jgi:hypothetical protein
MNKFFKALSIAFDDLPFPVMVVLAIFTFILGLVAAVLALCLCIALPKIGIPLVLFVLISPWLWLLYRAYVISHNVVDKSLPPSGDSGLRNYDSSRAL